MMDSLDSKRKIKYQQGFSLLELVVVLALVGLLAGGGVLLLRRGVEGDLYAESQSNIEEARLALQAFLKINGRLPYPYNSGSTSAGAEYVSSLNGVGYLPFAVLGTNPADAWHRPIRFALNTGFMYNFTWSPPVGSTIIAVARTQSCNTIKGFFANGYYPNPHWPFLEDPAISATRFPIPALLVSGGTNKNGNLTTFFDKKNNLRDNNVVGGSATNQTAFIRPLPGTVLAISGGIYDDILVTLDPATLYQWALCTPPLP